MNRPQCLVNKLRHSFESPLWMKPFCGAFTMFHYALISQWVSNQNNYDFLVTTCIVFCYLWELSLKGPSILSWKTYLCSGCGCTYSWAPGSIKIKETLSCRRCFFPHLGALQYNSRFRDLVLHLSQSSYDMPSKGWRTQVCSLISRFSLSGLPYSVRGATMTLPLLGQMMWPCPSFTWRTVRSWDTRGDWDVGPSLELVSCGEH